MFLTFCYLFLLKILMKLICICGIRQLPGLISLSSKFLPTVMNLLKRLAEEGQNPMTNDPNRNPATNDQQRNPALESRSFRNGVSASSSMSSSASSEVISSEYASPAKED